MFCQVKEQDDKDNIGDDVIGRNLRAKHIMNVVECEDANENTPISEAGSMRYYFVLFLGHKDSSCIFKNSQLYISITFFFFLIQFYVPFKIISAHMRRANQ